MTPKASQGPIADGDSERPGPAQECSDFAISSVQIPRAPTDARACLTRVVYATISVAEHGTAEGVRKPPGIRLR